MFDNNKKIKVEDLGQLAYYPNRDSLKYLDIYDVPDIKTFMRATLRHPQFCKGWQALIELGYTQQDDAFDGQGMTFAGLMKKKTGYANSVSLQQHVARKLNVSENDKVIGMLQWLGLFDEQPLKPSKRPTGDILLDLLLDKWKMASAEKDMVVMQHEIEYLHKGKKITLTSGMVLKGENREHSAMAKTVGLPIAVLARMVLTKKLVPPTGVLMPVMPSIYRPVLTELAHHGIIFKEEIA
jgi:saccharopine dehydrogenase-like NADP-dependent oxidoreductase